jgi:hypothetical protein
VPKLACYHLKIPLIGGKRPISLLGGLTSFGGAGNNYSMHVCTLKYSYQFNTHLMIGHNRDGTAFEKWAGQNRPYSSKWWISDVSARSLSLETTTE